MPSSLMEDFQIRDCLIRVFGNGLASKRFLTPITFRSSRRPGVRPCHREKIFSRTLILMAFHIIRPDPDMLTAQLCLVSLLGEGCMVKKPEERLSGCCKGE